MSSDLKIKFAHIRHKYTIDTGAVLDEVISPNGGVTVAYVVDEVFNVLGYSYAKCSKKDNYNKKVGRQIAQNRLKSPKHFQDLPIGTNEVSFLHGLYENKEYI